MEEYLIKILKNNNKDLNFEYFFILKLADKYNIFDYKEIDKLDEKILYLRNQGYLDAREIPEITVKTKQLFEKIDGIVKDNSKFDFDVLHKKLQDILVKHTSKKQKMLQGKYAFLPNSIDLKNKILKVVKQYKLTDFNKIETLLVRYVNNCIKKNFEYVQLLEYYIIKDKNSKIATDYFNFEEEEIIKEETIKNTKELF
jgi:hypothetical protein